MNQFLGAATMTVEIPTDLLPFVQGVIASGRCHSESDVVGEALRLFREVECRREELRREVLEGINSGESIPGDRVFERLRRRAAEIASKAQ
jgi:putative addiction module CopG family antidote